MFNIISRKLWYDAWAMIWTLSDLHLSFAQHKPMDIFGSRWKDHPARIEANWRARVRDDDIVLVAGDISWAMHVGDAMQDLRWINALPGQKILSKVNHDYWWDRAAPLRPFMPHSIQLIEASAIVLDVAVVCGTRGWVTPEMPGFAEASDTRVYNRELIRLDRALDAAQKIAAKRPIIVMIHYPPFVDRKPTEFARRMAARGVAACVYGHLHRPDDWAHAIQGTVDGVFYQLSACDYLGFGPVAVRGLG